MANFVKVASKGDVPPDGGVVVEVQGRRIAIFNVGGEFYAIEDACPHRGGPLGSGYVDPEELTVQCPWHGWEFYLQTGNSTFSSNARVECFPIKVEGDDLMVALE